jgi:hypothetical protein
MGINRDDAHRVLALFVKTHGNRCAALAHSVTRVLWMVDVAESCIVEAGA